MFAAAANLHADQTQPAQGIEHLHHSAIGQRQAVFDERHIAPARNLQKVNLCKQLRVICEKKPVKNASSCGPRRIDGLGCGHVRSGF
jgi:hypothetical protein